MREIDNITLQFLKLEDYGDLKQAMIEAYPNIPEPFWKEKQLKVLVENFTEGQIVIMIDNEFAGCALSHH